MSNIEVVRRLHDRSACPFQELDPNTGMVEPAEHGSRGDFHALPVLTAHFHANLAELYRKKIAGIETFLTSGEADPEAFGLIRNLVKNF